MSTAVIADTPPSGSQQVIRNVVAQKTEQPRSVTEATGGSGIRNAVVANVPQPESVTAEGGHMIQYDRDDSRIENKYRVFGFQLEHQGVCRTCFERFRSASRAAAYCSTRCKNDAAIAARKLQRAARRGSLLCHCGEVIVAAASGRVPTHCSPACKQRAYRERKATS